jgi:hypothetical protein
MHASVGLKAGSGIDLIINCRYVTVKFKSIDNSEESRIMARIDDYQQARDLAARALAGENLDTIARRSGFKSAGSIELDAPFLDRIYSISYPEFIFTDRDHPQASVPLQEQVLILHYLQRCQARLAGRWVAYREIPGAGFYFGAFVKRAVDPLKKAFGQNVAALQQAATKLGATPVETGSAGFRLDLLPYAPVQIIVWEGDDEFPAEANILFDAAVGDYLSPEDAAWLASLAVYRLMALARPA